MSSSETTQSSFQCLKSCLADKLSSNTNTTSIITSSVASNTNNNNSTTITASNPTGSNSNPSHIVVNNYPSHNNSHITDNCSESVQPTQFTFSSPQALTTRTSIPLVDDTATESCIAATIGPVTGTTDFLRDRALQVNGASSGLKISDNHLSTKLLRNNSSPYPSLRNQSNTLVHTTNLVKQDLAAQIVSKETSVDQEMFENGPVNNNNIGTPNGGNHSNLMGSSGILSSSVGGGVNNIMMKHEPNGNNIEITIVDNQHHHHLQQNGGDNTHHLQNHSGINLIIGGDSSACCSPAGGGAVSDMDGTCSGASSTTSSCGIQVLDNFSHNHNHGLLGSSSLSNCGGMPSGNANGGGSLTSPGGSLDEHDCDDDKVINGDTFTTGDVPEPDAIKMFVGQIPKLLNEAELRALFEEFGRVFQINVLRDKVTKQSKGCCFVTYYTRKAALEAQNALHNVKTLSGMSHPLQMKPADNENRYERKLFVGMISKKCNEVDIRNMFSRYGIIDECTVLRDGTGASKGCAFITFATKQCAQNAIKAVHQSISMEGCTSPIVVKFADTQKDKDQKRHQQLQASIINNISATTVNPIPQQYISEILKLRQILSQLQQQQQQQQQQNNYFSQLSPLGVQGIAGLGALTSHGSSALAGLNSQHQSSASSDLATLAAIASLTNVASNQHSLAVGVQNLATLAALGNHSTLSPSDFNCSGANGSTMGSTNTLANFTGNGLHAGLSSYTGSIRNSVVNKQVNVEGPEGANLFIYHLPAEFSDADLATMFTSFGNVISAKVFIDKQTNLSKCFGFVSFDNVLAAQLAIQAMNGFQIGMKRLKVQLKKSKDSGKPY